MTDYLPGVGLYLHGDAVDGADDHYCARCDLPRPKSHLPHGTLEGDLKRFAADVESYGRCPEPRSHPRPNLFDGAGLPEPERPVWTPRASMHDTVVWNAWAMGLSAYRYFDLLAHLQGLVAWAAAHHNQASDPSDVGFALQAFGAGSDEARHIYEGERFHPALAPEEEGLTWAEICELAERVESISGPNPPAGQDS